MTDTAAADATPTPETDKHSDLFDGSGRYPDGEWLVAVDADFARTLERQRDELQRKLDHSQAWRSKQYNELSDKYEAMRKEVEEAGSELPKIPYKLNVIKDGVVMHNNAEFTYDDGRLIVEYVYILRTAATLLVAKKEAEVKGRDLVIASARIGEEVAAKRLRYCYQTVANQFLTSFEQWLENIDAAIDSSRKGGGA